MKSLNFHIISLFPEAIDPYLDVSIIGRARQKKLINVSLYQLRDFEKNNHKRIDDRPYAGGPGMVLRAEPILNAVSTINNKIHVNKGGKRVKTIIFSARGKQFTSSMAAKMAKQLNNIILIAGRYEGIDARVKKILHAQEISIGPYILTGGEIPAILLVDTITRQIPSALGKEESLEERRVSSPDVYTRPEILHYMGKKYKVPKILLSGNHNNILAWKIKKRKKIGNFSNIHRK